MLTYSRRKKVHPSEKFAYKVLAWQIGNDTHRPPKHRSHNYQTFTIAALPGANLIKDYK